MSWPELKRDAGAAERALDAALARYLRVEVDRGDPEFVSDAELAAEREVELQLKKLHEAVERLAGCADRPATAHVQLQRLREIGVEQRQKFRASQNRLKQVRESEALRRVMQRDARAEGDGDRHAQELLMRERTSVLNSSRMAGEIINQAVEVHGELLAQRSGFSGTAGRLVDIGRQVPGLNTLIQRIENKRTRDNTIIAIAIAFGVCFMLWYWLRGWGVV
jgi:hypothetical protein